LTENIFPEKFSLEGKTAMVAGGAGLIGKIIVTSLAQAGAKVYIGDANKKEGINLEKQNSELNITWISLDITDIGSIKSCIEDILKKNKKIDIWINCAYPRTKDWDKKFEDVTPESLERNVAMHLNGYFLCCQQIAEQMKKQKTGSIINFSSIYGVVGPNFSIYEGTNMTVAAAYSAIKGGIVNFTRYLATYYGKYGVRVNAICPGGIFDNQPKKFLEKYEKNTPLGRMGNPEDMAGPVIFLSSDAASYVTGHILMVDGGWTTW